jgi:hypothetical protein
MKVTRCTRLFFLYSCTLFFGLYQLNKHTPSEELPVARSSSSNNNTYTDLDLASVSRDQIQPSHGTAMNRYPEEYTNLKAILEQSPPTPNNDDERKILSFGCSTGEEPLSLAQLYFPSPSVKIFGVDVADKAIGAASEKAQLEPDGKITIIDGRINSPKAYGPFDIVLANSVFCIYGMRGVPYQDITYVMEHFSFDTFQNMLSEIDSYLKVDGVLAIHNSNYNFMDTQLYVDKYEAIESMKCPNHFVPRIDRLEKKFVDVGNVEMECVYRKRR